VGAGDHASPAAIVAALSGQRGQSGPWPVGDPQARREPHEAAGLPDPVVELPVLDPHEPRVITGEPVKPFPAKDPEETVSA